jgi:hypothetical protein
MAAGAGHLAGFYHAQVMIRDSNGYPKGSLATPNSPVNGTAYHAYKITGPVSASAPTPTREIATFRGGMVTLGQRALGTSDFGTFDFTTSAMDEVLDALFGGSSNDTTNFGTANVAGAPNTMNANLPQFILALTAGFQTSDGTNRFMTWFYPNVQIAPPGYPISQDGGVNPNPTAFTVIPSASTRTAQGYLFSATTMGLSENKDIVHRLRTDNPIAITTYVDDGSATTIAVGYRPTNSEHAGAVNIFTKNGVKADDQVSGFSTTTGATTHTAGSAGDIWVITYETNFVAI